MNGPLAPAVTLPTAHSLRWRILLTLVAAQFMFVVDAFIVNVAIPAIRADLGATAGEIAAVLAVYQIAYASLVITGGRCGDLYGAKPVFLAGLLGFVASSLWCGLARSGPELIAARLAQGATAALMVPQVLGTIHVLFDDATERARAFGLFGVVLGLGGAVGFMLGGVLVSLDLTGAGWRAIFFVNVPVGLAVAVAAFQLMPARNPGRAAPLDIGGAGLLFVGLLAVLGPVMFGHDVGWPFWLAPLSLGGAACLIGFVAYERARERRGVATLIAVPLLRDPVFLAGAGAAFAFYGGNISFYLVTTVYMQNGLGFTPLMAALAVLPLALAFTIVSRGASARVARRGIASLIHGCALELVALFLLAGLVWSHPAPTLGWLLIPLTLFGIGQGFVMAPLFATILSNVRRAEAGVGAGMLATVQQSGNAAGVALIGTLYFALTSNAGPRVALLASLAVLAFFIAAAIVCFAMLRHLKGAR